jgi:hypothetical protein
MMKISNAQQLLATETLSTQDLQNVKGGLTISGSIGRVEGSLTLTRDNISLSFTRADGTTTTLSWGIADDDKRRERPGGIQTQ